MQSFDLRCTDMWHPCDLIWLSYLYLSTIAQSSDLTCTCMIIACILMTPILTYMTLICTQMTSIRTHMTPACIQITTILTCVIILFHLPLYVFMHTHIITCTPCCPLFMLYMLFLISNLRALHWQICDALNHIFSH